MKVQEDVRREEVVEEAREVVKEVVGCRRKNK